ncbi:hypothetical protein VP1G_07597 [Cytospora mali]|uniref:Uncharacterized protein n=1 Tax=Cytospora mali TaxID=578113 RepID=A0A194V945_CYTMA|nr:hypothetical protein VP1G_07597 [Valsa mali var. pyri (nom. inval.)]
MPKGLIPLMLSTSSTEGLSSRSRSSVIAPARPLTRLPIPLPATPAHKRNASDITPMIKVSRPPVRTMKRQSQQVPASLPVLPYTQAEWKKAITEIKRYHITRRHRACSARCSEILTNTKDISKVEPAYLIYLNFYAAISLEMCARPLQAASSYRTSLLQQARGYYEKAASLIQTAEEAVLSRSRSSSSASSVPSLHSPSGSVSSRAWTPETMTPTCPTPKKPSLQQEPRSVGRKERPKKKVSFELPKDQSRWSFGLPEPIVRPDSPTLGFDEEYFAAGASRQELPELPGKRWSRPDLDVERIETMVMTSPPSMPSISEREEFSPANSPSSDRDTFEGYYFARYDDSDSDSGRSPSPSLSRYCETLSALRTQVASHTASLDELLRSDQRVLLKQEQPESPPSFHHDATGSMTASFNRMSMNSLYSNGNRQRSTSIMSFGSYGSSGDEDEARMQDRRARIDKLRMNGWKRKRFDSTRYEELCEQVMAELDVQ